MTTAFDPYRELLDIKSPDRPPDHYALLGVALFESEREKIDDAAGERMSMLQELANSEHLDASQKLLNEVSAARRCLLDATKKMAYDEDLRTRQRRFESSSAGKRGRKNGAQPFLPIGVAIGIVVLLCGYLLTRGAPVAAGNLIVDWPVSERQGARILLDGSPLTIPDTDPISLKIPTGRRRVIFQRTGYNDIPKTIVFSDAKIKMSLIWVATKK